MRKYLLLLAVPVWAQEPLSLRDAVRVALRGVLELVPDDRIPEETGSETGLAGVRAAGALLDFGNPGNLF